MGSAWKVPDCPRQLQISFLPGRSRLDFEVSSEDHPFGLTSLTCSPGWFSTLSCSLLPEQAEGPHAHPCPLLFSPHNPSPTCQIHLHLPEIFTRSHKFVDNRSCAEPILGTTQGCPHLGCLGFLSPTKPKTGSPSPHPHRDRLL